MRHTAKTSVLPLALLTLACGAASSATCARSPCELVSRAEAARLLGVSAGKTAAQEAGASKGSCVIRQADDGESTLTVGVTTVSRSESSHLRNHMDDERGNEASSDEPWFEVSAVDPKHPHDRRLVIHRDRTTLTLDLHSSHQTNARRAFESVWHEIAERLPSDEER
ncbi:MAG TPA: hypothetical protein VGC34_14690 [Steroidobacteraceae bacterium]